METIVFQSYNHFQSISNIYDGNSFFYHTIGMLRLFLETRLMIYWFIMCRLDYDSDNLDLIPGSANHIMTLGKRHYF